ncbi:MAG TPA: competence/damage-inducible protein A [Candidatus Acidoferrum sp.]|nr:competence/damage-inducible protein A [Candidatus Acidoferrum sp.]
MEAEIITIGDEIVTGHTVDTNSSFIAARMTDIGIPVKFKTSVGDTMEGMEEAFRLAIKRCQIVICTGGLGPTDDDITKRAIVKVFKRNLIFHEDILKEIKRRYTARGVEMPAINQNQALLPQGARFFPNKYGSAVGICIAEDGRIFVALPGVPMEMKQIVVDEVVPYLRSLKTGQAMKIVKLRTTGIIESKLAELIVPSLKLETGVRLAYLPSPRGVDLRILAQGDDEEQAQQKALTLQRYLESVCGRYIYGYDDDTLEGIVGQLLVDNDKTLAVAESCTGGQLGMAITSVPGSSRYFVGGVLAYANDVKIQVLGVDEKIIAEHGAVSRECAVAMAVGVRRLLNSDYALSVTGIAGPDGGTDAKPIGTIFTGLASARDAYAREFHLGTNREYNRSRSVYTALELLRREILDIQ